MESTTAVTKTNHENTKLHEEHEENQLLLRDLLDLRGFVVAPFVR
jgi:hypothetical protein